MAGEYTNDPCKEKIQALVDSYNDHNSGNLFESTLKKGIRKRLFGLRTQGIQELERFLKSPGMKSLDPKAKITGENLKALCTILSARDDRIYGTRRSYERYPDKKTNQVFQRIYTMLWLNMGMIDDDKVNPPELKMSSNLEVSDLEVMKNVIFKREKYKILSVYENNPDEFVTITKNKREEYRISNACKLGLALTFGTIIKHTNEEIDPHNIPQPNLGKNFKVLKFKCSNNDNIFYGVVRKIFDIISLVGTIPDVTKFDKDIKNGLKWLEYASKKGEQIASFELARIYAADTKLVSKEVNIDKHKTMKYLKLASKQGSIKAAELLTSGGKFGEITIPPQNSKRQFRR